MGLVVHTSAFTAHRSVILGNSGLSEISTQTLGNVNIHAFGGGYEAPLSLTCAEFREQTT